MKKAFTMFIIGLVADVYFLWNGVGFTGAGHGIGIPYMITGAPEGFFYLLWPILFALAWSNKSYLRVIAACLSVTQIILAVIEIGSFNAIIKAFDKLGDNNLKYFLALDIVIYITCHTLVLCVTVYRQLRASRRGLETSPT